MFINETYLGRFCTVCIKLATILAVMTIIMSQVVFAQSSNTDILSKNLSATVLFAQGKSYHDGNGVSADITKAIAYYEQAAKLGNTDAKLNLGYIYFTGQGGEQNYAKARQYYLQAAGTGDTAAQENLGLMYEHGLGVKANQKTAKIWYDKSKGIYKPEKSLTSPIVQPSVQEMDLRENITPETLEKIEIPTILISQSQLLEISPSRRKKTESGINAISDRISGETAHAAPAKSLIPFEGFRDTDFDTIHLPAWVGSLISLCLLLLAILSAIWFVVKLRNIQYRNARYKFTSVFFENHRESLRSSYLRTPHSHRRHSRPSQPWAVSLCALMVRFATNRQSDPDVNCPISKRVVKRLTKTPYAARAEVFGFIPMVQDRLYFDIDSLSADKLSPLKPYQFGHSKFFSNKARKNKLK